MPWLTVPENKEATMQKPNLKTCSRLDAIEWFLHCTNKIISDMREQIDTVQSYRDNSPFGSQLQWDSERDMRELAQMEKHRDGLMRQLELEKA